jgi:DNA-binding PadR family transcriptional regulator
MPDNAPRFTSQTLQILHALLADPQHPRYGLEIAREAALKTGTIYPALARLEKLGVIASEWEDVDPSEVGRPRRRLYKLTGSGERVAVTAVAAEIERLSPRARTTQRRPLGGPAAAS